MLRIVLDTNVIISAALSPTGMCAKIFDSIARSKEIQFFYNADILIEYQEVLSRKHLNIDPNKQAVYLGEIKKMGMEVVPTTSTISMPDKRPHFLRYGTGDRGSACDRQSKTLSCCGLHYEPCRVFAATRQTDYFLIFGS